jgi:hypothetical protein
MRRISSFSLKYFLTHDFLKQKAAVARPELGGMTQPSNDATVATTA